MIDPHVHLRDGAQANKETLLHGMGIGVLCGITAFFDMPNTAVPLTTEVAIRERLIAGAEAAQKVSGNTPFYGVYGGVTAHAAQVLTLVKLYQELHPKMVGMKMFAGHSTGSMGVIGLAEQRAVYQNLVAGGYRGVLAVHCEKESLLRPELWNKHNPASHILARPGQAEVSSVADQIALVRETGFQGTLHICHISTAESVALVEQARIEGMRITCGVTPHHALLNDSLASTEGNLLKMNPPLRSEADRKALFTALCEGRVDWIESDHAPHTLVDKAEGASGIPGFAGMLLLLKRLQQAQVAPAELEQLYGKRVCTVFDIDLPVTLPDVASMDRALAIARSAYPWDPFGSITP